MVTYKSSLYEPVDLDVMRYMVLNSIRKINSRFREEYGEIIIAVDAKNSWRKQVFPYYKSHREINRKESAIDWPAVYGVIATIKTEIEECLPYKIVEVSHAEADDIIGELARACVERGEKCLIVSRDKDFLQLQVDNIWVKQWDKINEVFIVDKDPKRYLFEHVIKGDRGDGIPNILSPADSFINGIRQTPVTSKRLAEFWDNNILLKDNERFKQNLKIIDLRFTPQSIKSQTREKYQTALVADRSKLMKYFINKQLKKLVNSIGDF